MTIINSHLKQGSLQRGLLIPWAPIGPVLNLTVIYLSSEAYKYEQGHQLKADINPQR